MQSPLLRKFTNMKPHPSSIYRTRLICFGRYETGCKSAPSSAMKPMKAFTKVNKRSSWPYKTRSNPSQDPTEIQCLEAYHHPWREVELKRDLQTCETCETWKPHCFVASNRFRKTFEQGLAFFSTLIFFVSTCLDPAVFYSQGDPPDYPPGSFRPCPSGLFGLPSGGQVRVSSKQNSQNTWFIIFFVIQWRILFHFLFLHLF